MRMIVLVPFHFTVFNHETESGPGNTGNLDCVPTLKGLSCYWGNCVCWQRGCKNICGLCGLLDEVLAFPLCSLNFHVLGFVEFVFLKCCFFSKIKLFVMFGHIMQGLVGI